MCALFSQNFRKFWELRCLQMKKNPKLSYITKTNFSLQMSYQCYLVLFRIFLRRGCSWLVEMFTYPYRCRIHFCLAVAYSWTDALPGFPHLVKNLENLLDSNIYDIQTVIEKYDKFFLFVSLLPFQNVCENLLCVCPFPEFPEILGTSKCV